MILRDAVLAEERVELRSTRPSRISVLRFAGERRHEDDDDSARGGERLSGSGPYSEPTNGEAPSFAALSTDEPPAPVLTFEAVAGWLALQDSATRGKCVEMLDDDLTAVRAAARSEGFAAGEAAGMREAEEKTAAALEVLGQLASSGEQAFEREAVQLLELCSDVVAQAVLKIAGPLLGTREVAFGAVVEVLKRVKEEREVTIRVNAADLKALQSRQTALSSALGGRSFVLVADSRVGTGGCIVEAKLGNLDGRIETQLRECCETLRAAKHAHAEPA